MRTWDRSARFLATAHDAVRYCSSLQESFELQVRSLQEKIEPTFQASSRDALTGFPYSKKLSLERFAAKHGFKSHLWIRYSDMLSLSREECFMAYRVSYTELNCFLLDQPRTRIDEYNALDEEEKLNFIKRNSSNVLFNMSQIDKPWRLREYAEKISPIYADSFCSPRFSMHVAMMRHSKRFHLKSRYWMTERMLALLYEGSITVLPDSVALRCYYDETKNITLTKAGKPLKLYNVDQTSDPILLEKRAMRGHMKDLSKAKSVLLKLQNPLHTVAEKNCYTSNIWFPSAYIDRLQRIRVNIRHEEKGTLVMVSPSDPVEFYNASQTDDPSRVESAYALQRKKLKLFLNVENGEPLGIELHPQLVKAQKACHFTSKYWIHSLQLQRLSVDLRPGERSQFSVALRGRQLLYYNVSQVKNPKDLVTSLSKKRFQREE